LVAERREERPAFAREARFEARGAVAVAASPRLGAAQIAAAAPCVGVLNFHQIEEGQPVLAFLGEWRRAIAHLDPLNASVLELSRGFHIAEIFVAGNRARSERAVGDGRGERFCLTRFESSRDKVAHLTILRHGFMAPALLPNAETWFAEGGIT
jgi:hypothetical protein